MTKRYNFLVGIAVSAYILIFSILSFLKYRAFEYRDFDLAAYSQIPWNIFHGSLYCSLVSVGFLGNHAHFILFLIAPVYGIFPHPLTLLFLQTLALGLTAVPLYLIAREQLNFRLGLMVTIMYLLYPPLAYANLYEFHLTAFAAFFLAWTYYYFYRNKFFWFMVFMFFSLFCQENISLIIFMFGISAIFLKKDKKFILLPLFAGVCWFLFCFYLIIPYFNRGQMQFISFYSHLGSNMEEVALSFIARPLEIIKAIWQEDNLLFLLNLFFPLSFMPFIGFFEGILMISPILLQHILSNRISEKAIQYHYAVEMVPFVFIAFIYGLKRLKQNKLFAPLKWFIGAVFVFSLIVLSPLVDYVFNFRSLTRDRLDRGSTNLIKKIPASSGVVATFRFLPHLANRKALYSFHNVTTGHYPFSRRKFDLPDSVEYALVDFSDPLTLHFNRQIRSTAASNLWKFVNKPDWGIVRVVDSMVLFKKGQNSSTALFRILDQEPNAGDSVCLIAGKAIELLEYRLLDKQEDSFKVKFYWRCLNKTTADIGVYFDIIDARGKTVYTLHRLICYGAYPTFNWEKGQIIEEDQQWVIPGKLPQGKYVLKLGFYDNDSGKSLMAVGKEAGLWDKMGRRKIDELIIR